MTPAATPADEVSFISGRTRLFGIVGHPIAQVRSPEMVTAEMQRRGAEAIVVPIHVLPEDFEATLPRLLRLANLGGLIFTIPYKARALALADALEPQGRLVGAINALTRRSEGGWVGEMLDGMGCVEAFRRRGHSFAGKRVMLIGAGGAGAAIGVAIALHHAAALRLFDVDQARAAALAAKLREIDPKIVIEIASPRWDDVDVLLNASPVGMLDDLRLPITAASLPPGLIVFDAVVKPERTPLLALAEASGCTTITGREMMRGQIAKMVDFFGYPERAVNDPAN
jgi:shikimate dehydrogenase